MFKESVPGNNNTNKKEQENKYNLSNGCIIKANQDLPFLGVTKGMALTLSLYKNMLTIGPLSWSPQQLAEEIDKGTWTLESAGKKKITVAEWYAFDPENGSDLPINITSSMIMHPSGHYTRETLIEAMVNAGGKSEDAAYRNRVEKTVDNFLANQCLIADEKGGLKDNFDVA